jgi:Ca2+-binding RTX toxin-like protein
VLEGGDGLDRLFGGEDDDTLSGGAGSDYLDGGTGIDVAKMTGVSTDYLIAKGTTTNTLGVTQDLYYLTDKRASSPDGVEQLTNVETLQFSDKSIALTDFYAANKVGNITNDSVTGTDGADALFGYGGDDTLLGGRGDDVLYGD